MHRWFARDIQPGTKQASMFAVAIPFILITGIVLMLRIHVRMRLLKLDLALDDYLMIAGTIFAIGLSVANMFCGWYGAGMHTLDIPAEDMTPLLMSNYATRLLYVVAICLVKFSILVFYMKLDPRKPTRWVVYFLMAFVAALTIATFFILALACVPPSMFWDLASQALHPEKCLKQSTQQTIFVLNGILNIVQDVAIYVLPIPMIWKLQMPRRHKIALCSLLCVGLVAVAAGCVRFYYVLFLAHKDDLWFYMADSLNWCSIEIYAAIICSSASTFKALLKTYVPRIWGSSRGASSNPRHQYDQSVSGRFAMKPFGAPSSKKTTSNRKYGINDITEIENDSEEAIVPSGGAMGLKTETTGT